MNPAGMQVVTQVFAERMINSAAAGVILSSLVWVLLRLIGRHNAGTRFAVWFSALLAIVAFPFVSASTLAHFPFRPSIATLHGAVVLSNSWASYLCAAWVTGVAILGLRLAVGLWRVHVLRRNCADVDLSTLPPAISAALGTLPSRGRIALCTTGELAVPAVLGLFRPAIVFPEKLLPQLSPSEIEMIVRHELAHLERWDDWTNLVQKLVKTAFFFHPAVWWIENRLTLEREMACDDAVLEQTASPRAYASSLISFAEKLHRSRGLALAQALVSRAQQISVRVAQILSPRRPGRTGLKPVLGLSAGLLAIVLGAAPYMPRLVAFQSEPSHMVTSNEVLSAAADATAGRSVELPVALQRNMSRPKAIPAAFRPRTAPHSTVVRAKVTSAPLVLRTSAGKQQPIVQQTIFILRPPQDDASFSSVPEGWTLCIWTWDGTNSGGRTLRAAILVRWI